MSLSNWRYSSSIKMYSAQKKNVLSWHKRVQNIISAILQRKPFDIEPEKTDNWDLQYLLVNDKWYFLTNHLPGQLSSEFHQSSSGLSFLNWLLSKQYIVPIDYLFSSDLKFEYEWKILELNENSIFKEDDVIIHNAINSETYLTSHLSNISFLLHAD